MKNLKVLVTGCGGDIGQSIGKILKQDERFSLVIGCDIHEKHAGIFIFDKCFVVPRITEFIYFEQVNKLLKDYEIDIILISSEPELRFISENKVIHYYVVKYKIVPNYEALLVGFDKLYTVQKINTLGFKTPFTQLIDDVMKPILPCIVKSRTGAGSKNLFKVYNMDDFKYLKKKYSDYIYQEYIDIGEGEYSCGVFRTSSMVQTIIFKRDLLGGFSGYGEIEVNTAIENLLIEVAESLELQGSINIQLRLWQGNPMVFEINPRFSSTVLFRHLFGFKDVIWSIQNTIGEELDSYVKPQTGGKFYKGFSEYINF